ncbi:hypothetical protein [Nonomuraea sp. B19D2]|uniref:hypothetical protein n=1 Tax=Nonomuraea sp. B19D2 TaxID=3159561 RepID=UPI0032D9F2D4
MNQRIRDFIREFSDTSIYKIAAYVGVAMGTAVLVALFSRYFSDEGWIWVGIMAVVLLVTQARSTWIRQKAKEQSLVDPHERLRTRIEAVNKAFTEAATLMDELQRDLTAQEAARRQLVAEAEHQQHLIGMNREEAEAVRRLILGETRADIARQRRDQWVFFMLGAVVSIPIGVVINLLVP